MSLQLNTSSHLIFKPMLRSMTCIVSPNPASLSFQENWWFNIVSELGLVRDCGFEPPLRNLYVCVRQCTVIQVIYFSFSFSFLIVLWVPLTCIYIYPSPMCIIYSFSITKIRDSPFSLSFHSLFPLFVSSFPFCNSLVYFPPIFNSMVSFHVWV